MRKVWLNVLIVSAIILVSISFMAASCTVTPGPGPTMYTLSVTNNSGVPLRLEIHDDLIFDFLIRQQAVGNWLGATGSISGEGGYYFRVRNMNTGAYLQFNTGNTYWYIAGSVSFTVGGGGWVTEAR